MGFRDDQLADKERVRALEGEVARLQAENAALKAPAPQPKARQPQLQKAYLPLGLAALACGVGAALLPLPPALRMVLVMSATLAFSLAMMLLVMRRTLLVVEPGEWLVLSGRPHRGPDGQVRGYRVVTSGRALRMPLLESAAWMNVGPFPFEVSLSNAYSRGSRVVHLRASAAIALSSDPLYQSNAIERFLGRAPGEVVEVARQTIEGALRSVVAELSVDELQQDTPKVREKVLAELEYDLEQLGLSLVSFAIDDVAA